MELVCIGGASDGARVNYDNPPKTIRLTELVSPLLKFKLDSDYLGASAMKYLVNDYQLEYLQCYESKVFFYKAIDISILEALQLLVSNYAIGDPMKKGW